VALLTEERNSAIGSCRKLQEESEFSTKENQFFMYETDNLSSLLLQKEKELSAAYKTIEQYNEMSRELESQQTTAKEAMASSKKKDSEIAKKEAEIEKKDSEIQELRRNATILKDKVSELELAIKTKQATINELEESALLKASYFDMDLNQKSLLISSLEIQYSKTRNFSAKMLKFN